MRDDTPASLARLLTGLIDYAGLFPPAALPMDEAVERYDRYRGSARSWALGRFIVPAARFEEFCQAFSGLKDGAARGAWAVSVLADPPLAPMIERLRDLAPAGVRIESFESRVRGEDDLQSLAAAAGGYEIFAEMPLAPAPVSLLALARNAGCAAKIRTGGTTPQAFPASRPLAEFLATCVEQRVPFKATAGLHHPVRSPHPVTYEAGAPCATMHGFLNVFLGCVLLAARVGTAQDVEELLEEVDPAAFLFEDDRAGWRGRWVSIADIGQARRLARSFGSCSFEEPIEDLERLGFFGLRSRGSTKT